MAKKELITDLVTNINKKDFVEAKSTLKQILEEKRKERKEEIKKKIKI